MTNAYKQKPFLAEKGPKPLHLCNEFNIAYTSDQTEYLIENFEELVKITRQAVPGRSKNFFPDASERTAPENIDERKLEHELYLKYKEPNSIKSNEISKIITHIPYYQFPLVAHGEKEKSRGWGQVDLIGCTPERKPAIIELKRGGSTETPLRVIVEALAYAIALQEMWKQEGTTFRNDWDKLVGMDLKQITAIGLAPSKYWRRWNVNEEQHSNLQKDTGTKIEELRQVAAESGFHIHLASYEVDPNHQPTSEIKLITEQFCSNTH